MREPSLDVFSSVETKGKFSEGSIDTENSCDPHDIGGQELDAKIWFPDPIKNK